jgi:membrane-associated phospholipid phosphatase
LHYGAALSRIVLASLIVVAFAAPTAADPPAPAWYRGEKGKKRVLHLSLAVGGGLLYFGSKFLESTFVPEDCRWCDPPAIDSGARKLLVWDDTGTADILSSVDAYVIAPIVGIGLLYLSDRGAGLPRFLDDTIPVLETVVYTQLVVQTMKMAFARRRPFATYGTQVAYKPDENMSFPSGHSALGFAITTGAGMICHWRGYWTEPYVWASGIALSLSTEYLRIAADKHYVTDVLLGGAIGIIGGLTIPRLMRSDVKILPMGKGLALSTTF